LPDTTVLEYANEIQDSRSWPSESSNRFHQIGRLRSSARWIKALSV
jgi:hypothetical protein